MKKLLLVTVASLLLVGCSKPWLGDLPDTKPVQAPDLPVQLSKNAMALQPLTDNTMGGRELDATETDRRYNEVAHQTNALIRFYNCVKDSVNNKKDIKQCLKD